MHPISIPSIASPPRFSATATTTATAMLSLSISSPGGEDLTPAHLGRTTSLPCIASPTSIMSPSSSPYTSALSSPSNLSSPTTPLSPPQKIDTSAALISIDSFTLPPVAPSSAPGPSSRVSFFSLSASTSTSTATSTSTTSVTVTAATAESSSGSLPSSSLFKSITRPLMTLYASLRISCLPTETSLAHRQQWREEQLPPPSPLPASMSDTEMGSIAALGRERRRVRETALSEIREVRELKDTREASSRHSQVSRVSRVSHIRRSSSSLSRWRASSSRSSRAPSSPSSLMGGGGGDVAGDESLEDVTDCSDVDDEREEVSMAVFNASPLVLMDHRSSAITPVSRLDIDGEKEQIRRVIAKTTAPLHCTFHQLTLETLSEELIAEPDILHLSGHGLHTSDGAYALALEHDNGSVSLLSMPSLARLLSALPRLPKLVVILACHSESAGQVFADVGVEHVICVRGSERILDSSAKYFAKFFYASLIAGFTVGKAFEVATRNVEVVFDIAGKKEAAMSQALPPSPSPPLPLAVSRSMPAVAPMAESAKFVLLPAASSHSHVLFTRRYRRRCTGAARTPQMGGCTSPQHGHSPSQSSLTLFPCYHPSPAGPGAAMGSPMSPLSPLPPTWSPSPLQSNLPSRPSAIVGREIEVQRVISALLAHRLVNVYGKPKSGKTSVALLAAHFQRERGRYEGGCFYVSMKGVKGMEGKEDESEEECKARETRLVSHLSYVLGLEDAHVRSLRHLYQLIRDHDILLVFDDCSSSPSYSFLLSLLLSTTRPKVMAVSDSDARHYFALDSRQSTASVEVAALSPAACLQLIRRLCQENGWTMREGEMIAFASLCGFSAWNIVVRMRRVAMKEKEGGKHRTDEGDREESVRGGEGEEMKELGEVREEEEGEEESALKLMQLTDFVDVIEVETIPQVMVEAGEGR